MILTNGFSISSYVHLFSVDDDIIEINDRTLIVRPHRNMFAMLQQLLRYHHLATSKIRCGRYHFYKFGHALP